MMTKCCNNCLHFVKASPNTNWTVTCLKDNYYGVDYNDINTEKLLCDKFDETKFDDLKAQLKASGYKCIGAEDFEYSTVYVYGKQECGKTYEPIIIEGPRNV